VVVSSPEENEPKYVRYLFNVYEGVTESAEGDEGSGKFSLMNAESIPASSFITDDAKPFYRNH
jgi:hypothetical protein